MKFPIIIEDPGTIILYNSLSDAELDLEVIDVCNALYRGWDATGRLLNISTEKKQVIISLLENEPTHAKELEDILREHLEDIGKNVAEISSGDLISLIDASMMFLYTHQSGWEALKLFFDDFINTLLSKPIRRKPKNE